MGDMTEIVEFLVKYPLKEEPYPKGYPEDLRFDLYPGKDFVVGFCEEAIDEMMKASIKAKDKEMKKLCRDYAGLFRQIMENRIKKLNRT